jgi:transposase
MSTKRYPEEFKTEAVRQVVERGHKVADVAARLGVSQHSLYKWINAQASPPEQRQAHASQAEELRHLKAELRRVTEERDILKKAAAYFARQSA